MSLRSFLVLAVPLASSLQLVLWIEGAAAEEPSGLLAKANEERLVLAGRVQAEIENSLSDAKRMMDQNPAQAEQDLKLSLDGLERLPELTSDVRGQLRRQLQSTIRLARRQKVEMDQRDAEAREKDAAAREQQRLSEHFDSQQQRIKQIVDRFNALLDEGQFAVADEQIAPEIERLRPGSSISSSLVKGGSIARGVNETEKTWRRRNDSHVHTLASVESAAVAFPDDTPIVYLPAEQWQGLTNQRDQYKAVDLHKQGNAEQRILRELHHATNLDVVEMPLKDVVNYLAELHNIPIMLATKKLEEADIRPDTPVTKTLRGVTLRSVLRLILKDLELTYLIQDEVIQITTPEDASIQLSTKVYPVGDLVVPVSPPQGAGGVGGMNGGSAMNPNGFANPGANNPLFGPQNRGGPFGPPF